MNPYSRFSVPTFDQFVIWLSTTDLRLFFYRYQDFERVLRYAHVLGAATLFGSILLMHLNLLVRKSTAEADNLPALAVRCAMAGGAAAMLSGVILFLFDPIAVGIHTFFLPKMLLIVLATTNALAFHALAKLRRSNMRRLSARAAGVISIVLWAGVFLCATLNSSERIAPGFTTENLRST